MGKADVIAAVSPRFQFVRFGHQSSKPASKQEVKPASGLIQLSRNKKKFNSLKEADALMHTELKKRGITAETLWAKWGVWSLVSSYNHLAVKLDPQKKPSGFNQSVFLRWFAQQVPEYHKGMMAGETEETAWANVREESSDGCCGNGCRGCLKKNPGLLA